MFQLVLVIIMIKCSLGIENIENERKTNFKIRYIAEYYYRNVSQLRIYDFNDFKKVDLNGILNRSNLHMDKFYTGIELIPNTSDIILDTTFEFERFVDKTLHDCHLKLIFFKGFNVQRFRMAVGEIIYFYVNMFNFKFDFYDDRGSPLTHCDEHKFTMDFYFKSLWRLTFGSASIYSLNTCNLIFKNAKFHQLYLQCLTDTFVKRNILGFVQQSSNRSKYWLNTSIDILNLYMYRVKIDQRVIDTQVFQRTQLFSFEGEIVSIEPGLFRNLDYLWHVELISANVRSLFSRGIGWIDFPSNFQYLNMSDEASITWHLDSMRIIQTHKKFSLEKDSLLYEPYLFPDEDFCWFVHFPFNQLIFIDPHTECKNECSCTQYWLLQFVYLIPRSKIAYENIYYVLENEKPFSFTNYYNQIEKCNFPRRILNCNLSKQEGLNENSRHLTFDAALYYSAVVDFAAVLLLPLVGILGIFINIINIKVITSVKLTEINDDFKQSTLMRLMLTYSIVNLLYCLIHCISPISKCIDEQSLFCSRLYYSSFAQYYKIIGVELTGSMLKTLSNIVYFAISVDRYILLEKESLLALMVKRTISTWSKKKKIIMIALLLLVIIGTNVYRVFNYKVQTTSIMNTLYDFSAHLFFSLPFFILNSHVYDHSFSYDSHATMETKSTVTQTFTYFNFVVNDVLLFVIFSVVDIKLVITFKKMINTKKNIFKEKQNDAKLTKQINEMEQTVEKILKVIIVNTVILLLIKSFDFYMSVARFQIWKKWLPNIYLNTRINVFCYTIKICSVYDELVKLSYMFYYCFTIVPFYFMNKHFRTNFRCCCCSTPSNTDN